MVSQQEIQDIFKKHEVDFFEGGQWFHLHLATAGKVGRSSATLDDTFYPNELRAIAEILELADKRHGLGKQVLRNE